MTIEERAINSIECYECGSMQYVDCDICIIPEKRKAYIQGATEQHKIDIDKAIEWIKYNNENGGCQFDNWEESFRKTME